MTAFKLTRLQPGDRLRVVQGFTDFDGVAWAAGRTLEFVDYGYVPYDGGYTFWAGLAVAPDTRADAAAPPCMPSRPHE